MRLLPFLAFGLALCGLPGASLAQSLAQGFLAQDSPPGDTFTQGTRAQDEKGDGARSASGSRKAVVELFTSQGCSSCPAADALLKRLADRDGMIALSMSVDYWDYLGWKDTLASPVFSERQRAYARARGDGAIYTPQVVVNGVVHVNGSDEGQIIRAIDRTERSLAVVPVRLHESEGKLIIEAGDVPRGVPAKDATIWLAVIAKSVEVPIQRGENQGKTITYYNVVRELRPVGKWSGKAVTVALERSSVTLPGAERCAVLLQQGHAGAIIGAALMKDF